MLSGTHNRDSNGTRRNCGGRGRDGRSDDVMAKK